MATQTISPGTVKKSSKSVISAENFISDEDRMTATEAATTTATYIVKIERYDEDIMAQMLVDPRICTDVRKRLSNYYKHRTTPSEVNVSYGLSKNRVELRFGRLYPTVVGLQSFRRDIRTPLLAKYYWDIDIANCHYNIALKFARDYGIRHEAIERYCKYRDECLALYSDDGKVAKLAFLKIAYGGDISLYREDYEDCGSHNPKPESHQFIRDLKAEMTTLAEIMWGRFPHLQKLKGGKENKPIEKRPNKHAVLMSEVFQEEEKKSLRILDDFYASQGRYMGVLIHDGGCVEKLSGELEFPEELLRSGAEAIRAATGYDFTLESKSMRHSYEAPIQSSDEYAKMKADFEKRNFMIGGVVHCITATGTRLEYKFSEASIKFANRRFHKMNPKTLEMEKVPFLPEWIKDENRRDYEECNFIPNVSKCPPTVFNLFHGFAIESVYQNEITQHGAISKEDMMKLIEPIREHNRTLCGNNEEQALYYEKWEANILQNPDIKSDVACFFRDKGGLLFEGGGTGKNLKMDWFGNQILGESYYLVVDDNSLLYGNFNSVFEGKLLVFIEEAAGKDNHNNGDVLKSKITKKRGAIKKKMVAEYEVNDYARFVFGSNNQNPIPIRQGDRRLFCVDVDATHRGDEAYFKKLTAAMDDVRVQCAYYQYLMTLDIWKRPIDYQLGRPITECYIDIRQLNAPAHMKWLRYELRRGTLPRSCGAKELYERYTAWCNDNRKATDTKIEMTTFGKLMKEVFSDEDPLYKESFSVSEHRRSADGIEYRFNFKKLIEGMERLHLLQPGECRVDDECLIKMEESEEEEEQAPPMMGLQQAPVEEPKKKTLKQLTQEAIMKSREKK
jgi:hypothetical protein